MSGVGLAIVHVWKRSTARCGNVPNAMIVRVSDYYSKGGKDIFKYLSGPEI